MIEVNMTVNELTEDANMKVDTVVDVSLNIKNPFFNITLINNKAQSYPPSLALLEVYNIVDGNLIDMPIVAEPSKYAEGRAVSMYADNYDVYYLVVPDNLTVSDDVFDLVNCHYDAFYGWLIVEDTKNDASAVLILNA